MSKRKPMWKPAKRKSAAYAKAKAKPAPAGKPIRCFSAERGRCFLLNVREG